MTHLFRNKLVSPEQIASSQQSLVCLPMGCSETRQLAMDMYDSFVLEQIVFSNQWDGPEQSKSQ